MRKTVLFASILAVCGSFAVQAHVCEQGHPCQKVPKLQAHHQQHGQPHHRQVHHSASHHQQAHHPVSHHRAQAAQPHHSVQVAHRAPAPHRPNVVPHYPQPHGMYRVTAQDLNMRAKPGPSPIHGRLHYGETIKVVAFVDGWAKIIYGGHYHWISARYIHHIGR